MSLGEKNIEKHIMSFKRNSESNSCRSFRRNPERTPTGTLTRFSERTPRKILKKIVEMFLIGTLGSIFEVSLR